MNTKSGYVSPNLTCFGLKMATKIPLCKRWRYQCGCWFIVMKCCKVYCMQVKFFIGLYHGSNVGGRMSHITLSFQQCITPWIDLECNLRHGHGQMIGQLGSYLDRRLLSRLSLFGSMCSPRVFLSPKNLFGSLHSQWPGDKERPLGMQWTKKTPVNSVYLFLTHCCQLWGIGKTCPSPNTGWWSNTHIVQRGVYHESYKHSWARYILPMTKCSVVSIWVLKFSNVWLGRTFFCLVIGINLFVYARGHVYFRVW
jgi:hypothetical protein